MSDLEARVGAVEAWDSVAWPALATLVAFPEALAVGTDLPLVLLWVLLLWSGLRLLLRVAYT